MFLHYGWFLQNLEKGCIRTNMHTTVHRKSCGGFWEGGITNCLNLVRVTLFSRVGGRQLKGNETLWREFRPLLTFAESGHLNFDLLQQESIISNQM